VGRGAVGEVVRDSGTTILAFVEDPDGYKIELLGKKRAD